MRELALFAGAGGGILGGLLLGWCPVCAVELDAYCRSILLARQRDGILPRFPVWDDVRTFDGAPWRGHVDVISGGFPCQDISSAGKRAGITGSRSGLWKEFARIIEEVCPNWVFIENSPCLRTRGLVTVLQDLARLGFDARWGVVSAASTGAPHMRKRIWIVAHSYNQRQRDGRFNAEVGRTSKAEEGDRSVADGAVTNSGRTGLWEQSTWCSRSDRQGAAVSGRYLWWPVDCFARVDDGLAHRMDRIRATGNGQVPRVAALAWETLKEE